MDHPSTPISICMPAYNAGTFIRDAIESILKQTFGNFVLTVADNCSQDDTVDVVREMQRRDDRIRLIERPQNVGLQTSVDHLIKESEHELVAVYHADDIYEPTIVEEEIRAFQKYDLAAVFTRARCFHDVSGKRVYVKHHSFLDNSGLTDSDDIWQAGLAEHYHYLCRHFTHFNCPSLMIRKSRYLAVEGYGIRYAPGPEDIDLMLQLLKKKNSIAVINRKLINVRFSPGQGSSSLTRDMPGIICRKWAELLLDTMKEIPELATEENNRLIRKRLSGHLVKAAYHYRRRGQYEKMYDLLRESKRLCVHSLCSKLGLAQRFWPLYYFYLDLSVPKELDLF